MARKKTEGEIKSHQQHLLMAPSEVEAVDDWAFANRIRSRGEAIRRLCQIGIAFDERAERLDAALFAAVNRQTAFIRDLAALIEEHGPHGFPADAQWEMISRHTELLGTLTEVGVDLSAAAVPAMHLRDEDDLEDALSKARKAKREAEDLMAWREKSQKDET